MALQRGKSCGYSYSYIGTHKFHCEIEDQSSLKCLLKNYMHFRMASQLDA